MYKSSARHTYLFIAVFHLAVGRLHFDGRLGVRLGRHLKVLVAVPYCDESILFFWEDGRHTAASWMQWPAHIWIESTQ